MKKYVIAALAALAGFGIFASAAGLLVEAPTLQVGQTDDLDCTEAADVVAWGYNDHLDGGPISYATVELSAGHTCDGDRIYVTPLKADGSALGPAGTLVLGTGTTYQVPLPGEPSGALIEGVRIGIDQGY